MVRHNETSHTIRPLIISFSSWPSVRLRVGGQILPLTVYSGYKIHERCDLGVNGSEQKRFLGTRKTQCSDISSYTCLTQFLRMSVQLRGVAIIHI